MRTVPVFKLGLIGALVCTSRATAAGDVRGDLPSIKIKDNLTPAGTLRNGVLTISLELRSGMWYPEADSGSCTPVHTSGHANRSRQPPAGSQDTGARMAHSG